MLMMNNVTATTTLTMTTAGGSKEVPFWVYIIWAVVGLLLAITVIIIIFFCVYNSRKKLKNRSTRTPPSSHINDVDLMEAYNPEGLTIHLNGISGHTKKIFSASFVDHMRIPRAMEVKMAQTVSQMNSNFMYAAYNAPLPQTSAPESPLQILPKTRDQTLLSVWDWGSVSPARERKVPSRQSSFRLQEIMDEEERAERINKEKMLVYELREKLRRQGKIEEE